MGISDSISDIIDPRSSEIYILIPCPNKPIFLFSDINYTLGLELFDLKNINEKYQISAKRKAYMQYQKYIYVPNGYNFSGELVADLEEGLVYKASN